MLWNKCTVQQATEKNFSSATSALKKLCPEHRLLKQVTKFHQKYNPSILYLWNKDTVHQVSEKRFHDKICSQAALPWTKIIEAGH